MGGWGELVVGSEGGSSEGGAQARAERCWRLLALLEELLQECDNDAGDSFDSYANADNAYASGNSIGGGPRSASASVLQQLSAVPLLPLACGGFATLGGGAFLPLSFQV
ncbi:hypothetical protein FOA52_012132 [Chlamydomonas sp. UWO 241]|nr:hypothetical protein FOA52_012132 [Chlamydomonas sp. UWO 241]